MHGALLVDKPSGPTSHDIVAFTRRVLKTKRVGHTGTLDPLATGLLVMLVGHATRLSQFLVADEKEYVAEIRLGVATRTYDAASLDETAVRCPMSDIRCPMPDELERVLDQFRGSFLQMPPQFSAKKVAGVAAYERARQNQPVDLKRVPVTVQELQVLHPSNIEHRTSDIGYRFSDIEHRTSDIGHRTSDIAHRISDIGYRTSDPGTRDATLLRLRVVASSGFYVRSLAHDIGQVLGCGGHLEALRRTRVGRFSVESAARLDVLEAAGQGASERLISLNMLLSDLPAVSLTEEGLRRAGNGNALAPQHLSAPLPVGATDRIRVLDAAGEVLSVAERRRDGLLHPLLVLR